MLVAATHISDSQKLGADACSSQVSLRPVVTDDEAFLFRLYSSTRQEELAVVPWSESQKQDFLRFQFSAQQHHYGKYYSGASFDIVLYDSVPVGRLYLARLPAEFRVVDIALLPEYRRLGIGGHLMAGVFDQARKLAKSVSIHVERFNPAIEFYHRLGFQLESDLGVYLFMKWSPERPEAEVSREKSKLAVKVT